MGRNTYFAKPPNRYRKWANITSAWSSWSELAEMIKEQSKCAFTSIRESKAANSIAIRHKWVSSVATVWLAPLLRWSQCACSIQETSDSVYVSNPSSSTHRVVLLNARLVGRLAFVGQTVSTVTSCWKVWTMRHQHRKSVSLLWLAPKFGIVGCRQSQLLGHTISI